VERFARLEAFGDCVQIVQKVQTVQVVWGKIIENRIIAE
jgi:hypothetical protein